MERQVHIYSLDTSHFYNTYESSIHRKLNRSYLFKKTLKKHTEKAADEKLIERMTRINSRIKALKQKLYDEFTKNQDIRVLCEESLKSKNIISVFDSVLTRTIGIPQDALSEDIIVVQTYFFSILEDLILKGFYLKGEKYICFTASAGQIRTKKTVFIRESLIEKHYLSLSCGLTIEDINNHGGVNINKYLAYLALCNSATDEWNEFNIDKTIVVEDMETTVRSLVDFIDENTYEITRQEMDILINHTDGCGMILPRKNKKSIMIRLPWIKGLLVPFPFDKFIREHKTPGSKVGIVKDIYGKEHDVIKEGIEVILTKSQFKMWKYYSSWEEYKEKYRLHSCHAGKCNEEDDVFADAKLNYQMLQTLPSMTDDELLSIATETIDNITRIGRDKDTMLKVLGVTPSNKNKNYIQQALEIYPELLNDTYCKEILKQVKKSKIKAARAGKLDINGKYTFISPDLFAFSEFLFLGDTNPKGLLDNGEVYCGLFVNRTKLDCLRSPHLYREHAVRINTVDKCKGRWFVTKALYTSCHDPISKILMFDNDGDKALVCADPVLVSVAEREMQDIVPLNYNMAKAGATSINEQSIYAGLKAAYTGGNIGVISNDITKIWNSDDINLDVIKWLCMENNFVIDYAKTLFKLERPEDKNELITRYTNAKTPFFFKYAKDKLDNGVEHINNSVVNRLNRLIPNTRMNFVAANLGKLDYKLLLSDPDITVELDNKIIDTYSELDIRKKFMSDQSDNENEFSFLYRDIRNNLLDVNHDINHVVDTLVEYLYGHKDSSFKTTLWCCFGDIMIANLKRNVSTATVLCERCGTRIVRSSNSIKYCKQCFSEIRKEYKRMNKRKNKK
ncbi:hypothetical protein A9X05_09245 [Mycobacterium sp. E3298]|nr:hypothetical protein [Mycobacterium sp. E3298]OBG93889.1 hypothetical protein A9X05_09245 [Mycobacterium sp. E3298]